MQYPKENPSTANRVSAAQGRSAPSLFWAFCAILAVTFIAEIAVMLFLPLLLPDGIAPLIAAVADALSLALLSGPILWLIIVRPLGLKIGSERAQFERLIEMCPDGMIGMNTEGRIIFINDRVKELFGWSSDELVGQAVEVLLPERIRARHIGFRDEYMETPRRREMGDGSDLRALRADETEFPVEISLGYTESDHGRIAIAAIRDITERKEAEQELHEANVQLKDWLNILERRNRESRLLNEMGELLQSSRSTEEAWTIAGEYVSRILPVESGALYRLAGAGAGARPITTWGKLAGDTDPLELDACWALRRGRCHTWLPEKSGVVCSHPGVTRQGGCVCIPIRSHDQTLGVLVAPIAAEEAQGQDIDELQELATDIAERIGLSVANVKLRETLHEQAMRDSLTGLFNRRCLDEFLDAHGQSESRDPISFLMIDIDLFKRINDSCGHDAGDQVLRWVARLLMRHTRADDFSCRYGGEEFLLALPGVTESLAAERGELIRAEVAQMPIRYEGKDLPHVTVSVGVASCTGDGDTPVDALLAADAALYLAKKRGRNRVVIAEDID